jgi:hypothetical protein
MDFQGMGKSMRNRECAWVYARLPLWVDDGDGKSPSEVNHDAGDLTAKDHHEIERHLAGCASCRRHSVALQRALDALAAVVAEPPVAPPAPSLWPMLERRIAGREIGDSVGWPRVGLAVADRSLRPWGDLDDERPLRQAWACDTIRELVGGNQRMLAPPKRTSALLLRASVAIAVAIALVGFSVVRRQWLDAQSTIVANSVPLPEVVAPPIVADLPQPEVSDRDTNDVLSGQLADTEPVRTPESPASVLDAGPVPKSLPRARFGFDLEHGTLMPPDTREPKPVY